jgi:hypothetical protein
LRQPTTEIRTSALVFTILIVDRQRLFEQFTSTSAVALSTRQSQDLHLGHVTTGPISPGVVESSGI